MGQSPHKGPSLTRDLTDLTRPEGKGGKSRRRMASEQQINRLPWLLAVKMIQISFANRLTHQSTTSTNKQWQWRTQAEHSRLKSGPPLMRRLGIHKNILVSDTKLMLGLWVGFICSHLTADKLFPVNSRAITGSPKMSFLLEAKGMSALIITQRLILVAHMADLAWMSNQQQQILIQNLNRIASRPNVTKGQILHCTTNCIPINLMF